MKSDGFVHLHTHTEFSLLDGACRIKGLVSRVKELGQTACAITDHGVMFGVIDFYNECLAEGIKPIIGCEVYVAPKSRHEKSGKIDNSPYHLILLCENNEGYKNLTKLVSDAYVDGFYVKPRCDKETLREYHSGLICLSACLAGEIPRLLMSGDYSAAVRAAIEYRDIFGEGNYFLEVQNHHIPEQEKIIPYIYKISAETGIPVVATNDAHYLTREDADVQHVLNCIATNTTIEEKNGMSLPTSEFYIKSADEMAELHKPSAVENSALIAVRCNVSFEFGVTKLPLYTVTGKANNTNYFVELVKKGIGERYGANPSEEVIARMNHELDIIIKMGYVDYFLIVWDFVHYARTHGIPVGPGRGSGVGSVCAYAMGITSIDPIRFNLLFERFLNPERVSMPDFDIDFCYVRRQEVIDYVTKKYGADHVAQIVTFGTLAAKQAIRDVARAMGLPYAKGDYVAKLIPFELHSDLARSVKNSKELTEAVNNDPDVRKMVEIALKIEGMPRHSSLHAAGIVITRDRVSDYVPLLTADGATVTQYTMTALERLGLLKMDFLGLRYLTVIDDCEKMIREKEPSFSADKIDPSDTAVYEMLESGGTCGIFQFESEGMTSVLSRIQPRSLEDLIATISLYRPGPMGSIPTYIENRHHPESIKYKHPLLEPILSVTYGCIVYQEQVMQICRAVAGYSYGRADLVRRAMAKKKRDVMEKERGAFIYGTDTNIGAVNNGVPESVATEIFDEMATFATYAFNKSHAAAYAWLSYQTAFLRRHYFREYMIALMTSVLDNTWKLIEYIEELKKNGISVLPPDINRSELSFSMEGEGIRFGLLAIKNLGRNVIGSIIAERKNGEFTSLYDFCRRLSESEINKRTVEGLIKSGALDRLGHTRRAMFMCYEQIMDGIAASRSRNIEGQLDLFGMASGGQEDASTEEFKMPVVSEFRQMQLLQMEKESVGIYVSGHPIDRYEQMIRVGGCSAIHALTSAENVKDGQRVKIIAMLVKKKQLSTKKGRLMCFADFEDQTGTIETLIFPDIFESTMSMLRENDIFAVSGSISTKDEDAPKLLADKVENITEKPVQSYSCLYLRLNSGEIEKLKKITELLQAHGGNEKVRFCFDDTKAVLQPRGVEGVRYSFELIRALEKICGKSGVLLK